jgi:hypothetical protein
MSDTPLTRPHPSTLRAATLAGDGTNASCHGNTGGVQANSKRVIDTPQIILILWDNVFATNTAAVSSARQLVTDLVTGPFVNGLAQYGVAHGTLLSVAIIDTNVVPAPATWDISDGKDGVQLKSWLNGGTVSPAPVQDESLKVYLIILPTSTQLTNGTNADGTPNTTVAGWHHHTKYNANSKNDDLFWGVVQTRPNTLTTGKEAAFINSFAYAVGHELCEAFTNPDGNGYFNGACEIGDLCEADAAGNLLTFAYNTWSVEPYWSTWDNACIHGDASVSLRRFLTAINFDPNANRLGALGTADISLDYIASRMR